jgi:8-oxo-dGTP pyrophosphatase MutT (NUDIX family)
VTVTDANARDLRRRIQTRLAGSSPGAGDPVLAVTAGLSPEQSAAIRSKLPRDYARAAVLIPLVDRPSGLTVLLTQRASHLTNHAGQISFPGGRIESTDTGPLAAALRETHEEIGLDPGKVTLAGYLHDHLVITGFLVTPVVGFVTADFELKLDRTEVEDAFEVPLTFILDKANHRARERTFAGVTFQTHDIPYVDRNIWGATAGMLVSLVRLLEGP